MADAKVTALSALTAITGDDLLYVVDDPAGTPASKKATAAVFRDYTGMVYSASTVTTGNVTATVNTLHGLDIDGMTAARDFVLPTAAATGDRVGVFCTTDAPTTAAYVLQIKSGAAGDLINGTDHSSTIWSALLIKGECLIFRCIDGSTVDWIVEYDGRIPQAGVISLTTNATGETANTTTAPTSASGAFTATKDVGGVCVTASSYVKVRRASTYLIAAQGGPVSAIGAAASFQVWVTKNDLTTTLLYGVSRTAAGDSTTTHLPFTSGVFSLAAGDYVAYSFRTNEGSKGCLSIATPRLLSYLSVLEVL